MSNECCPVSNRTLLFLTSVAKNIQELSIQMNDKIVVESFWQMNSLKTLILSNDENI